MTFTRALGYAKHPLSVVQFFAVARFRSRTLPHPADNAPAQLHKELAGTHVDHAKRGKAIQWISDQLFMDDSLHFGSKLKILGCWIHFCTQLMKLRCGIHFCTQHVKLRCVIHFCTQLMKLRCVIHFCTQLMKLRCGIHFCTQLMKLSSWILFCTEIMRDQAEELNKPRKN